jgi:Ca2+:H+ antiporter
MNAHATSRDGSPRRIARREWPLALDAGTAVLFLLFGSAWLADLSNDAWFAFVFAWLLAVILISAFAVVRHAECLAVKLGEPLGTLILTLSVTGVEVMMIAAVMYAGTGGSAMARDAMFAVVMIVLNGMIGTSLLLGGLRHHEQTYNLQGANAFLSVIVPLSVLGLVLPDFTMTTPGPMFSVKQSVFLIAMSLALYTVFLLIQNLRHKSYFIAPRTVAIEHAAEAAAHAHPGLELRSVKYHTIFLIAYLIPLVILAKQLGKPIKHAIEAWHAPASLGGLIVAALVLSPESVGAVRAAVANELQRSVNILLGSVLATISLTIPAVLTIGLVTDQTITLGLDAVDTTLLLLTLAVSTITFASARTNVLSGAVHLLLFLAYLMLIFEK